MIFSRNALPDSWFECEYRFLQRVTDNLVVEGKNERDVLKATCELH